MKKNTLLYLNKELVDRAKKHGLNLSKITESSIKAHLFPYLSVGEKIAVDFDGYLKDLEKEKKVFFLPHEIKQVRLKDIGPCKNINMKFKKFNIITGPNGCGKTTVIRSIAYMFGHDLDEKNLINHGKEGEINLKISSADTLIANFKQNKDPKKNIRCVLIDGAFARLNKGYCMRFFTYLKKLHYQIIMTGAGLPEIKLNSINVINL